MSHGFFVHDDWRVGEKLTLNLGVRYDLELGMTEAENRNVRGFDFTTANPIQAQAQAQFAANPPAGVPLTAAQFAVLGGYQYVDETNRRIWDADTNNFQPRFGFTYAATANTIVRGGAGLFISPFQINAVPGPGESRQPAWIRPSDTGPRDERQRADVSGESDQSRAERAAPATEWLEPRAAHQPRGQHRQRDRGGHHPDRSHQPRVLAVQPWRRAPARKRLARRAVLSRAEGLARPHGGAAQLRARRHYRTTSAIRDNTAETFLSQVVSNPFQGLTPDTPGSNGATIARRRLLLQYPHFDNLSIESYRGENTYHALLARLEKRFTGGLMVQSSLHLVTLSRAGRAAQPLARSGKPCGRRRSASPHHPRQRRGAAVRAWAQVGQRLECGRRRHPRRLAIQCEVRVAVGRAAGLQPEHLLRSELRRSTGSDVAVGQDRRAARCTASISRSSIRRASTRSMASRSATRPDRSPLSRPRKSGWDRRNIRTFPTTLPHVRFQAHHLMDVGLTKNFRFRDRVRVQVRIEALNAENYTLFGLGNLTTTSNKRHVRPFEQYRFEHGDEAARHPAGGKSYLLKFRGSEVPRFRGSEPRNSGTEEPRNLEH